jgi:excisionase family DNA binding protein
MSDQEVRDHNRAVYQAKLNSIEDVMERLSVGRSTVFGLIASKELRSVVVGRRRLVPESALLEFMDSLEVTA